MEISYDTEIEYIDIADRAGGLDVEADKNGIAIHD
jgi:hypothetical protein